ncbi:hypothetical protein H9P43_004529 [Blastocladiella emersonii ATCC 22665]|nr:hypothetical protein H9P43_004529 [Blastocladiella emersonii ATCC 22665]
MSAVRSLVHASALRPALGSHRRHLLAAGAAVSATSAFRPHARHLSSSPRAAQQQRSAAAGGVTPVELAGAVVEEANRLLHSRTEEALRTSPLSKLAAAASSSSSNLLAVAAAAKATSATIAGRGEHVLAFAAAEAPVPPPAPAPVEEKAAGAAATRPPATEGSAVATASASSTAVAAEPKPFILKRWWRYMVTMAKQTWAGLKILRVNVDAMRRLKASKPEAEWTRAEYMLVQQTEDDLRILMPFLFCVLILDEGLPVLIYMGWVPAPCMTPDQVQTHRARVMAKRAKAFEHFRRLEPLGYSPYTPLHRVDRTTLQHFCRIFDMSAIGPRPVLASRLTAHLAHLRRDDTLLRREGLGELTVPELEVALEQRGFSIAHRTPDDMRRALAKWIDMTGDPNVTQLQWLVSRAVARPWSETYRGTGAVMFPEEPPSLVPGAAERKRHHAKA